VSERVEKWLWLFLGLFLVLVLPFLSDLLDYMYYSCDFHQLMGGFIHVITESIAPVSTEPSSPVSTPETVATAPVSSTSILQPIFLIALNLLIVI
jgi:hypothetical protein